MFNEFIPDLKGEADIDLIHYTSEEAVLTPDHFYGRNRICFTTVNRHFFGVSDEKLIPVSNAHKVRENTKKKECKNV